MNKRPATSIELEVRRLDLLFRQNITGALAILTNTTAFTYLAWPSASHTFLISWFSILNLSAVIRLAATRRWRKAKGELTTMAEIQRWHRFIWMSLLISGLGWGAIGWISVDIAATLQLIAAPVLIFVMAAGAVVTYSPSLSALYVVTIPATVPWVVRLLLSPHPGFFKLGVLAAIIITFMVRIGRNLHRYVDESLKLNTRLQESEERLRMARDSSGAVNWRLDLNLSRLRFEGNVGTILGPGFHENIQLKSFLNHVYPKDRKILVDACRGCLTNGHLDVEFRWPWPDQTLHWIAVRGQTSSDAVSGIFWDITAKKNEQRLARDREVFEASKRAKLSFLANVSHEIRTPLAAINGFAEDILHHGEIGAKVRDDLLVILRNGKYLVSVVNDLLDLSTSETDHLYFQKAPMSPLEEIHDLVQLIQPAIRRKNLRFALHFTTLVPEAIQSDATRLRQILINLLANAIKYTEDGEISLRLFWSPTDDGRAGTLHFIVTDTGTGLTQAARETLFQPFARGDESNFRRVPGSGLGLALSQSLARKMGGDVRLASSFPEHGSAFELTLPTEPYGQLTFVDGNKTKPHLVKADTQTQTSQKLREARLLLVDDDPDLRELMTRILERNGATVDNACNGEEAVRMALHHGYHVILMDIKMPILDGYRATTLLRQRGYRYAIVALTAHANSEDQQLCYAAGCDSYLSKPIDVDHLLTILSKQVAECENW